MEATVQQITGQMDLIYSPDDNGWYFDHTKKGASIVYETRKHAMAADIGNRIQWTKS